MRKEIICWGQADEERLTHTAMDDAIESILDGIGDLPETIEVCGYARREPDARVDVNNVLERILEGLDEEYGDPDGDATEPTADMISAEKDFIATVLDDYISWACELVKTEKINVNTWIKENRPDWIEDKDDE